MDNLPNPSPASLILPPPPPDNFRGGLYENMEMFAPTATTTTNVAKAMVAIHEDTSSRVKSSCNEIVETTSGNNCGN